MHRRDTSGHPRFKGIPIRFTKIRFDCNVYGFIGSKATGPCDNTSTDLDDQAPPAIYAQLAVRSVDRCSDLLALLASPGETLFFFEFSLAPLSALLYVRPDIEVSPICALDGTVFTGFP